MIKDRTGYDGTKKLLAKVQAALEEIRKENPERAKTTDLLVEIQQLEDELKEFENTIAGRTQLPDIGRIRTMPEDLIKWRLAKRWSQEELAAKADVDWIHLLGWEMNGYRACTFEEMCRIISVLEMQTPEHPHNELTNY